MSATPLLFVPAWAIDDNVQRTSGRVVGIENDEVHNGIGARGDAYLHISDHGAVHRYVRSPERDAGMPRIAGRILEQAMLHVHVGRVIDGERGIARILDMHVSKGSLAVLEHEDASIPSLNIQGTQADIGAAVANSKVRDGAIRRHDAEAFHLHALGSLDVELGVEDASATDAGLQEFRSGQSLQKEIVKTHDMNIFGAGSCHRDCVRRLPVQFGQRLIQ